VSFFDEVEARTTSGDLAEAWNPLQTLCAITTQLLPATATS
jgi:hypothetical protein